MAAWNPGSHGAKTGITQRLNERWQAKVWARSWHDRLVGIEHIFARPTSTANRKKIQPDLHLLEGRDEIFTRLQSQGQKARVRGWRLRLERAHRTEEWRWNPRGYSGPFMGWSTLEVLGRGVVDSPASAEAK